MEQFSGNYTGPYWSDGKLQESVAFGESEPLSELDALSRLHDTAYATYQDRAHREAADMIYNEQATKLAGRFPSLAGNLVLYGNYTARQGEQLARDVLSVPGMPLIGLIKHGIKNLFNANKMVNGTYLKQERQDIERLYSLDPRKQQRDGSGAKGSGTLIGSPRTRSGGLKTPVGKSGTVEDKRKTNVGNVGKTLPNHETKEERIKRLVEGQQRKFEAYQNTYLDTLVPSGVIKRKRKKKNLRRATRILPDHLPREYISH